MQIFFIKNGRVSRRSPPLSCQIFRRSLLFLRGLSLLYLISPLTSQSRSGDFLQIIAPGFPFRFQHPRRCSPNHLRHQSCLHSQEAANIIPTMLFLITLLVRRSLVLTLYFLSRLRPTLPFIMMLQILSSALDPTRRGYLSVQ